MKLYRSNRDKKVFGLCGGLAEAFRIDPTILRLIVAIGIVFSGGTVLLLYLLAALVIPKEPDPYQPPPYYGPQNGGWTNWQNSHAGGTSPSPSGPPPASFQTQTEPQDVRSSAGNLDEMMKDVERKALLKEIEELKSRLAKLEKQEKGEE